MRDRKGENVKYRNILVTGAMGFIGFNALRRWMKLYPECRFYGTHADTYADRFMSAEKDRWTVENRFPCWIFDLSDSVQALVLSGMVEKYEIDAVVHFAAESHVDNSISGPAKFFRSNVFGTANILEIARKLNLRVHIVSTDEVYGPTTLDDWKSCLDVEDPGLKPLRPSSPYSSSKAAGDLAALSYFRTYGTAVTVSRCVNNAGEYQHSEKLIGTTVLNAVRNRKIPVYASGNQKRHWIHVDDHNDQVMKILQTGTPGKIYNIAPSPENWITNMELIQRILGLLGKPESLIKHVKDRPGHDFSYFLTPSLNMKTKTVSEFLPGVVDWYARKFKSANVK